MKINIIISIRLLTAAVTGLVLFSANMSGQNTADRKAGSVAQALTDQLNVYPQEKIYLHTDKNHYVAGDTIWFRAYKVDAITHLPDTLSRYIYVELINPADSVIKRVMVCDVDSVTPGQVVLGENIAGGNYTLRAYTHYMLNQGEDYFFTMPVRISNPFSSRIILDADLKRGDNGRVSGDIRVEDLRAGNISRPSSLQAGMEEGQTGDYTLRNNVASLSGLRLPDRISPASVYVEYDNRLAEYVNISPSGAGFNVSFFPEGGHMLSGTACQVGFKSLDTYGYGIDITGEIYDSQGNSVSEFGTLFAGMGKFTLIPRSGEFYYALCRTADGTEKRFELPSVSVNGVGLKVIPGKGQLLVSVQSSEGAELPDGLRVAVHVRGEMFYDGEYDTGNPYLIIDPGMMPSGVCHILLTDDSRSILSERLVFIRSTEEADVNFSTSKDRYGYRDYVACRVEVTDFDGFPLAGSFSVSVTDDNDIIPDYRDNILSTLLLTSDLKGYIESPGWYFDPENGALASGALDALMLTQGWRRYDMEKLLKGMVSEPTEYFEKTRYITGKVTRLTSGRPLEGAQVLMFVPKFGAALSTVTGSGGEFVFGDIECPDSTVYYIQASSLKNDNKARIEVDPDKFPPFTIPALPAAKKLVRTADKPQEAIERSYVQKSDERWMTEHGERVIEIESVRVVGDAVRKENPVELPHLRNLGGHRYEEDYLKNRTITELGQLVSIMPNTTEIDGKIYTRGGRTGNFTGGIPVRFVLDGVIIDQEDAWDWKSYGLNNVQSVELVNGPGAAIFGSRGGGGVIVITSKPGGGGNETVTYNNTTIMPIGYQEPLEFYSPVYDTDISRYNKKRDLRTTIYWNPSLRTGAEGEAEFGFYSSDASGTYSVVIEGITEDGRVVRSVNTIVRN